MNNKRICIVRLNTTVVLIALMLFSAGSFAQVTLKKSKVPLEKVLNSICSQSGRDYGYLFDGLNINETTLVDIMLNNASFEQAIRKTLEGLPLTYKINGKIAVIKPEVHPDWNPGNAATINVTGIVFAADENKKGLDGAVIKIKNTSNGTATSPCGSFVLRNIPVKTVLIITYLGYEPKEVVVTREPMCIPMTLKTAVLDEVNIIYNGYQSLPKERATGSFILMDSALINRKVSTNILDRLDAVTSGVLFNKNLNGNTPAISIRDRSTIFANANPLVILDNFPYDGDPSNINPGDVKSITILKDAAAASIWGSRAGNGVIVITTKQGAYNQKPVLSFNTNVTVGNEPDQYFREALNNQEYTGIEQFLFDNGKFNSKISTGYSSLSPAVEVMLLRRKNLITDARKTAMLDSIAAHDNRADLAQYFYRKSISQQYQLSVTGGGIYNKYYLSAGYDRNLASNVTNSFDRLTVNLNNTTLLLKNKVRLLTGLMLSSNNNRTKGSEYRPQYPYQNVADQHGNPLAVTDGILRLSYVDTAGRGRLPDWYSRPLDELKGQYHTFKSALTSYKINLGVNYEIIPDLNASINYTYDKGITESGDSYSGDSYFTRNLINSFTQIDQLTGSVTRPIPPGDIVTNIKDSYHSHYGRGQLAYENEFASKHAVNVIAGYELKNYESFQSAIRLYGYDPATATNLNATINPVQNFPYYYNTSVSTIPLPIGNSQLTDRYLSYFANGSYTYNQRYIFSASARRDQSNIFGVRSNQKGVPLWSAGAAWDLSKEEFYRFSALPYVRFRATFGYSGNVDKTTSAFLTTQTVNGGNDWGQPILLVNNPPNPSLRWEKVQNINFGIDFGTKKSRLTGSLEYWIKDGIDLIGQSPIAPQTGVSVFKGNSANMRSKGIDLMLNTINIDVPGFKWQSTLLFNYNTDQITSYKVKQGTNAAIVSANYINPLEGYSYYSIFSYKWMGLDDTGSPQSLLNGKVSKDYTSISSSTHAEELVYSGTSRPKYYGSFRNLLRYGAWECAVNIIYKFDYYFRRSSLNNFNLYQGTGYAASYQQADYSLRWQKPGDELITNVPALIYPAKSARDDIYTYADILVEKADQVRLQDIRLNYQVNSQKFKSLPFSDINLYLYAANLGTLWKATPQKTDPDYPQGSPLPRTISLGFKANF